MTLLIDAAGIPIKDDPWHQYEDPAEAKGDYAILPAAVWSGMDGAGRERLLARSPHLGLELKAEEPWTQLGDGLQLLPRIDFLLVIFSSFRDGRGYSLIRRGREEENFRGEIRVGGDILADQIYFLKRCGANSFVIADDDPEEVRKLLFPFTYSYQDAPDHPHTITMKRRED